jgi:hypothetical protein
MDEKIDLQPEELEVMQAEIDGPEPSVLVRVDGPIRTQDLPRKSGATRTRTIGTTPARYLAADHRRSNARVVSIGQNMLVAFNMASAADPSSMAEWPAGLVFTLTADSELWLASKTATTQVSIVTEFWATGE